MKKSVKFICRAFVFYGTDIQGLAVPVVGVDEVGTSTRCHVVEGSGTLLNDCPESKGRRRKSTDKDKSELGKHVS